MRNVHKCLQIYNIFRWHMRNFIDDDCDRSRESELNCSRVRDEAMEIEMNVYNSSVFHSLLSIQCKMELFGLRWCCDRIDVVEMMFRRLHFLVNLCVFLMHRCDATTCRWKLHTNAFTRMNIPQMANISAANFFTLFSCRWIMNGCGIELK